MEMSLCSYLKQTKNVIFFFLLQNQRTGVQNRSCLDGWYQWEREEVEKGYRGANMMQILCTHASKCTKLFQEWENGR
jgi:hypothetical protein